MHPDRLVIIADAHLGAAPPRAEEALLAFLDNMPTRGDGLLVAGDLFDYWFSYRRLIPRRNFRVAAALANLARRLPVFMVGGNHDRWGDSFWEGDAGVRFAPHRLRLSASGRELLAIHGDGLHEERRGASWMHRLTSNSAVIAAYRLLHPDLGFWLADRMGHNLSFGEAHDDIIRAAAERQLAWATAAMELEPAVGALVMGHTHAAAAIETSPGRWYLNPGAWLDGHRYATLDADGARLHQFS